MSAKQSNCSVHLTLRTPCASSRDKESQFFCRSATQTFLRIFRVIIYRNVAMLLKPSLSLPARGVTRGMSVTQLTPISICPMHRPLLGRFYWVPKACQVTSLAGKHDINFQMAVEICFLFGKTIILLLSDRVNVISFAGFGYFFSESWVISGVTKQSNEVTSNEVTENRVTRKNLQGSKIFKSFKNM